MRKKFLTRPKVWALLTDNTKVVYQSGGMKGMNMIGFNRRLTYILGFMGLGVGFSGLYNNCSDVRFSKVEHETSKLDHSYSGRVLINQGDRYANSRDVQLIIESELAKEMYVTNDPSCNVGGVWEAYTRHRAWHLDESSQVQGESVESANHSGLVLDSALNSDQGHHQVYVRVKGNDLPEEGVCISDGIQLDNEPPHLALFEQPKAFTNIAEARFVYTALDDISGVDWVKCRDEKGQVNLCPTKFETQVSREGTHTLLIQTKDMAGNMSQPQPFSWVYDITPPQVDFNKTPPAVTGSRQGSFEFLGQDQLSGIASYRCKLNSSSEFAPCEPRLDLQVGEGVHQLQVIAIDGAGNPSSGISYQWEVDLTAPTLMFTSTPKSLSNSRSAQFGFTGMDNSQPITSFECQLDSGSFFTCSSPYTLSNLSEGQHKFTVRASDQYGNPASPISYSWAVDTKPPSVQIGQHPPAETNSTSATFVIVAPEAAQLECRLKGQSFANCSTTINYTNLALGSQTFEVRGTDPAGNTSVPTSYTWLIDKTPPTLSITSGPAVLTADTSASFAIEATGNNGRAIASYMCKLDTETQFTACSARPSYSGLPSGPRSFSVYVIDSIGNQSATKSYPWQIDTEGPMIAFLQQPPPSQSNSMKSVIEFGVSDTPAGVASVSCRFNGQNLSCASETVLDLGYLQAGNHSFEVLATDKLGNSSSQGIEWLVTQDSRAVTETFESSRGQIDVLVVIDDSGSMRYEQQNMAQRFSSFINQLQGYDWQLAVTTTDVDYDLDGKDGRFVPMTIDGRKHYVLDASMDASLAQNAFASAVQRPETGSPFEQGIKASYRSIERSLSSGTGPGFDPNRRFFRTGAALAIIVVSDSDETPRNVAYNGLKCKGYTLTEGSKNHPNDLLGLIETRLGVRPFSFYGIVVQRGDRACLDRDGNELYGCYYQDLAATTGGKTGTVCASDYTSQLKEIGTDVATLTRSFSLACEPLSVDGSGTPTLSVQNESGQSLTGFNITGSKLVFDSELPEGTYTLNYHCSK